MKSELTVALRAASLALLLAAAVPAAVDAASPDEEKSTGDSSDVTMISRWAHGQCVAAAAEPGWLWTGNGAVVRLFAATNPLAPVSQRQYVMPSQVTALAVWSHFLLVGTRYDGVRVWDVTDRLSAEEVASVGDGYVANVFCFGSLIYLACGADGLQVFEHLSFAAPATPYATYDPLGGYCFDAHLLGGYVLLAAGPDGVQVLDIDDLDGPPVATVPAAVAMNLDLQGEVGWVAADDGGLIALDITDPSSPTVISSVSTGGDCLDVDATADGVYVADGWNGLRIYDGSDPLAITMRSMTNTGGLLARVVAVDDVVYAANSARNLAVYDVSNPGLPALNATIMAWDEARGVAADGAGHLYLGVYSRGLLSFDVTDPQQPTLIGSIDPSVGHFAKLRLVGNLIYAAGGVPGLVIFAADNPSSLVPLGSSDAPNGQDVAVSGELAYVACLNDGVYRVNVADPSAPVALGSYDSDGTAYGLEATGSLVLLADGANGLVAIDFVAAGGPAPIAHLDTPGSARDVTRGDGPYAYVADYTGGLRIVNVYDVENLVEVGHVAVPYAVDVEVVGDIAYVACGTSGVYLVDVNSPEQAFVCGWYDTGGYATDLAVDDPHVYVADDSDGLWTLIYDEFMPVHLSGFVAARAGLAARLEWTVTDPDPASQFRVWRELRGGGREPISGLIAADAREYRWDDAAPPATATRYWLEEVTSAGSLWHGPAWLAAAVGAGTLGPTAWPNPFNPNTTVSFTLDRQDRARLAVYDLHGRRVTMLVDAELPAGEHRVTWDGRTADGRDAAAGTYLVRLATADRLATFKLSLVR